jgi:hypothetical protein
MWSSGDGRSFSKAKNLCSGVTLKSLGSRVAVGLGSCSVVSCNVVLCAIGCFGFAIGLPSACHRFAAPLLPACDLLADNSSILSVASSRSASAVS